MKPIAPLLLSFLVCACHIQPHEKEDHQIIEVKKVSISPTIDGKGNENSWNIVSWYPIDQNWLGKPYEHDDFNGRFKLSWDENKLYVLAEIADDSLYDQTKDPLKLWWNDDSIQIFLDEDNSGGLHQYSYNAFGYHIALDGNIVDLAPDKKPKLYNDHILVKRNTVANLTTWEMAITIYDDTYSFADQKGVIALQSGKKIGFALGYSDNDRSTERENFVGSVFVPGEDKNKAWIDADTFGTIVLIE